MKTICILGLLALATTAVFLFQQENTTTNLRQSNDSTLYKEYQQWKSVNKQNINGSEDEYRFNIFKANKKIVEEHNAQHTGSLRLGMNSFAALSLEEFVEKYTAKMTNFGKNSNSKTFTKTADVPKSVDWTQKGAVAPVENQGSCGSCWAFSTKEALEGIYQIKTGTLEVLSAQQLVDCSKWNLGCNGGDPMAAYAYTQKNGIQSEASYPYTSGESTKAGKCVYNADDVVFKNTASVKVAPENNADAIMAAAANQPLTIEVSAGNIAFQLYQEGVLDSKACGTALDHGVLLTGYDASASEPFWTIKNSWGTGWGKSGYANIALQPTGPGMCGIQQYAAYGEYNK